MPKTKGTYQTVQNMESDGYTSANVNALFRFPDYMEVEDDALIFGQVHTISYSIYRDKMPVRALGHTKAKGYTKGTRTVAGSISFMMLDRAVINDFIDMLYINNGDSEDEYGERQSNELTKNFSILPDELPPFDVEIYYVNQRSNKTKETLLGVELAEGNKVITVDDLQVQEQYSFVAHDLIQTHIEPMR